MKKLLIIIAVLGVLVAGAIKGFMWWSVKSDVDTALESIKVKADVSYESLSPSLDDSVMLKNVLIKPAGSRYEFKLRKLSIKPINPESLERAMSLYGKGIYPAAIEVGFTGLQIDLNKPLPRFFRKTPVENISLGNILAYGCGKPPAIDAVELQKMGFQSLLADGSFSYRYDQLSGDIKGEFELVVGGVAHSQGSFATNLPSLNELGVTTGLVNNKFESFSATIEDRGFHKPYIEFCMDQSGLDKEAFVKAFVARAKTVFGRFGISFNDVVWNVLADYQMEAGRLSFSVGVPPETDFSTLRKQPAQELGELFGLDISHNGKSVEKPGFGFDLRQYAAAIYQYSYEGSPWRTFVPEPPKKTGTRKKVYVPEYRVVSLSSLPGFKGRKIRVTSNDGNVKEGTFKGVQGNKIYISRQIGSGEGVFHVYSYETRKIEIFY